jgi:proline dehydrogenase
MEMMRNTLLWAADNHWMRKNIPDFFFVKKAVKKFMPGETLDEALSAASELYKKGITTVFTYLGENISDLEEADKVVAHYTSTLKKIGSAGANTEISLKLTSIGLDISPDQTYENFKKIVSHAIELKNFVWIDIEGSSYAQVTIDFYERARQEFENVGLCLQAYLFRTEDDIKKLLKLSPAIRLVKGAYNEPAAIAFQKKQDVDNNYINLSILLLTGARNHNVRAVFATHDVNIIEKILQTGREMNFNNSEVEFHLLYGIKTDQQLRLVENKNNLRVLISYGNFWYPWYMRRLAERPANLWFVLKNIF